MAASNGSGVAARYMFSGSSRVERLTLNWWIDRLVPGASGVVDSRIAEPSNVRHAVTLVASLLTNIRVKHEQQEV